MQVACPECDKLFATQYSMKRHLHTWHETGDSEENEDMSDETRSVEDSEMDSDVSNNEDTADETSSVEDSEMDSDASNNEDTSDETSMAEDSEGEEPAFMNKIIEQSIDAQTFNHIQRMKQLQKCADIDSDQAFLVANKQLYPKYVKSFRKELAGEIEKLYEMNNQLVVKSVLQRMKKIQRKTSEKMQADELIGNAISEMKYNVNKFYATLEELSMRMRLHEVKDSDDDDDENDSDMIEN